MGHVGSKTRSLCQISEKPCVRSRGHTFSPIIMKLVQNVCLDEKINSSEVKTYPSGVKTYPVCSQNVPMIFVLLQFVLFVLLQFVYKLIEIMYSSS